MVRMIQKILRWFLRKLLDKYLVRNILPCLLLKQTWSWGGYRSELGKWGENVRIGVLTQVNNPQNMFFEGNNFVWNYCILDAESDKIYVGENTQIGAYVGIFTHNTHISVRLAKEQSKKKSWLSIWTSKDWEKQFYFKWSKDTSWSYNWR